MNNDTKMGQLIAELMKWHGDSKTDASSLSNILLPHIREYAKQSQLDLLGRLEEKAIESDEYGKIILLMYLYEENARIEKGE